MGKTHKVKVNEHALTRVIDALTKDSRVIGYPIVSLEDNDMVVYYNYREHASMGQDKLPAFKKPGKILLEDKNFPTPPNHPRHNDYPSGKGNKKLPPRDDELDVIDG